MKKLLKVLLIAVGILAVLILALVLFLVWASRQPAVKPGYYEKVASDQPLEQKYTGKGGYEVTYVEYDAENEKTGRFEIWYPSELESTDHTYPIVVMVNGTGVPASKYKAVFDHLASWGFVVIGNEDANSWDGVSSSESLAFMLQLNKDAESIFYQKLDTDHIGIAGHSQGGVGAINAVTNQKNGGQYRAIYTASATWIDLANALEWPYDIEKVSIPYFFVAGTGQADAETISPLEAMKSAFDQISSGEWTVMARRKNTDHGEMLANADGYMTAWFMYHLKGDEEAGRVFLGENAEILINANWQDVEKNR
ncbi:MAG: alpha/beta hydrolase [Eubacteriales bacterium]